MKPRALVLCLLLLIQTSSGWAQSPAELSASTEAVIDTAYKAAGPDLGCLLYEPEVVLTVAGLRATCRLRPDKLSAADKEAASAASAALEKAGARLKLDDYGLEVQSLKGLLRCSSASRLPWVTPAESGTSWVGWEKWKTTHQARLENEGKENAFTLVSCILEGDPDAAVLAIDRAATSRIDEARSVRGELRYGEFLEGEYYDFAVLPEDASDAQVVAALRDADQLLQVFYNSPKVRARLSDPAFLAGRKQRRSGYLSSTSERWFRREDLKYALHRQRAGYLNSERLLNSHYAELVKMIARGDSPSQWYFALDEWARADDLDAHVEPNQLENWIWYGAFPGSPARSALYAEVRKSRPDLVASLAAQKLDSWQEQERKAATPRPDTAFVLFSHPDAKALFATLSPDRKEQILVLLNLLSSDVALRELLSTPPYKD